MTVRRGVVALAIVAIAVAAALVVGSAGDDSSARVRPFRAVRFVPTVPKPRFLSPRGRNPYWYTLAGNRRGDTLLVWSEAARSGRVRTTARWARGGGSFGRPRRVTGVRSPQPQVAVGDDGTAALSWLEQDGASGERKVATAAPGAPFGHPRTLAPEVSSGTGVYSGGESDLAVADDGTVLVTWIEQVRGALQVLAAVRSRDGHWAKPQVVTSGRRGVRFPRVAFDGSGGATLVWERGLREYGDSAAPPVKQQIRAAIRPPGGRFGRPQPVSDAARDARDASLAVNDRGDTAVVWSSTQGGELAASRARMAVRRRGGAFGAPRLAGSPGGSWPHVAIGPAGELAAVSTGGSSRELIAEHGSIDDGLGGARSLSLRGVAARGLTSDAGGRMFALWQLEGERGGQSDDRVQGRLVGAKGTLGPLLDLSPRGGDHDDPHAVLYPDGSVLAAWMRTRGPHDRIQAVRFRVRP